MLQIKKKMENKSFKRLVFIVRVAMSGAWQAEHQRVPLATLIRGFDIVTKPGSGEWNEPQVASAFTKLYTSLVNADVRLSVYYTTDIVEFFFQCMISDKTIVQIMKAFWTTDHTYLTCAKAAARSNRSAVRWRDRAAAGQVPGAKKVGKTWLIPADVLDLT